MDIILRLALEVDFWAGGGRVNMARQRGAGRRSGIFLQKIFVERWLRLFFTPPGRFGFWFGAGFSLQFEVIGEGNRQHVADRAEHAAHPWIFGVERNDVGVFEEADQMTTDIRNMMAGEGLQQPALLPG